MSIDVRDRKLLWGRAGNRCAFATCRELLVERAEETGRDAVVSQEAHIVAREPNGPRGDSPLSTPERDSYPNLVLLCLKHHKIIDDDPDHWTVERLHELKDDHEAWVETTLSPGQLADRERTLIYAEGASEWAKRAQLDEWTRWTSHLLAPTPWLPAQDLRIIDEVRRWLFTRPWPQTIPSLDSSFENFRRVLDALWTTLDHAFQRPDAQDPDYRFVRFEKRSGKWVDNYDELAHQSAWTVDLIHDLVFEATRAANDVCDSIRLHLDPAFRVEEGLATVERMGDGMFFETLRPRYTQAQVDEGAFSSIEEFLDHRQHRDVFIGAGTDPVAFAALQPSRLGD